MYIIDDTQTGLTKAQKKFLAEAINRESWTYTHKSRKMMENLKKMGYLMCSQNRQFSGVVYTLTIALEFTARFKFADYVIVKPTGQKS